MQGNGFSVPLPGIHSQNIHGDAHWMDEQEFKTLGLDGVRGVVLGQRTNGELIRFDADGHVMVFAPTGAGKGIGFVQPNLHEYQGSIVVIDPKAENAIVSAEHRRRMGQKVIVLDPFGMTGKPSDTYNPLGALTYASDAEIGPTIEALADAIIATKEEKDRHWTDGARKFASMLMWFLVAHEPPEKRNLIRLFELAHGGYELLTRIATILSEGRSSDPDVARVCRSLGNWFLGRQEREFSYFESVASNHLGWIGDFVWAKTLGGPPAPPLPLKTDPNGMTIYLVLPFERIDRYQSWLRLMVADLLAALFSVQGVGKKGPVLFVLDEAYAALGRMEVLFTAAAIVRSAGARLAFVYQDVEQIERVYGKAWQSLVANSGVTMFWSVSDQTAADYISRRCGQMTTPVPSNPMGAAELLLRPEAVTTLPADEITAFFRNASPAKFGRLDVRTDRRFAGLSPNTTYSIAKEKAHTARTEYVPVDLDVVKPKRLSGNDDEKIAAPTSRLEEISEVTGLPIKLLAELEHSFGFPLLVEGDKLGYFGANGNFETVAGRE